MGERGFGRVGVLLVFQLVTHQILVRNWGMGERGGREGVGVGEGEGVGGRWRKEGGREGIEVGKGEGVWVDRGKGWERGSWGGGWRRGGGGAPSFLTSYSITF